MPPERTYLSPAVVAEQLGLAKVDSVYAHIASGDLAAVNVGTGPSRPLWRISQAALDAFLASRAAVPAPKQATRAKPRRPAVTKYF